MKLSVIVPVHNAERYLAEALDSVIAQGPAVEQIIVADDGSTDASARIAQSYPGVEYLHQAQAGAASARNLGLGAARCPLVAFLDADDRWRADRFRDLPEALNVDEPVLVFGGVEPFASEDADQAARERYLVPDPALRGYLAGALVTQRQTFERVGPFDSRWRAGEFIDWVLRARRLGVPERTQPRMVLERRLHPDNHGRRNRDYYVDIARVVLEHRRALAAAEKQAQEPPEPQ